ncbi:MAG: hypothetical protein ACJAWH_001965 [Maribacter sp.]|jgi:hypothetical protein
MMAESPQLNEELDFGFDKMNKLGGLLAITELMARIKNC